MMYTKNDQYDETEWGELTYSEPFWKQTSTGEYYDSGCRMINRNWARNSLGVEFEPMWSTRDDVEIGDVLVYTDECVEVVQILTKDLMIGDPESGGPEDCYAFRGPDGLMTDYGTWDDKVAVL